MGRIVVTAFLLAGLLAGCGHGGAVPARTPAPPAAVVAQRQVAVRQLDLTAADVAFIGDDTNDLEAMQQVGLRACPADAAPLVRRAVHVVLGAAGGQGCVREFIDQFVPEG